MGKIQQEAASQKECSGDVQGGPLHTWEVATQGRGKNRPEGLDGTVLGAHLGPRAWIFVSRLGGPCGTRAMQWGPQKRVVSVVASD